MPHVACPKCSARLKVDDTLDAGDRIECTRCGKRFLPPQEEVTHRGKKVRRATTSASTVGCLLLVLVCVGVFIGWGFARRQGLDNLATADRLHGENKKAEAVALYKVNFSYAPADKRPEIVKRIADHEATAGDKAEARRWVEKGLDGKMSVTYETQAAQNLHSQVQRERAETEALAEAKRKEAEATKLADTAAKKADRDAKAKDREDKNRKYTRDEFKQLVVGRTRDEVLSLIGKPKATQQSGDLELWDYFGRTTDPVTGKTDNLAQVEFEGDRVSGVTFTRL